MQEMYETLVWSPGGGHCNPLQCSCLENPMHRGAWWATVHRVAKSWTWLKRLGMHRFLLNILDYLYCFTSLSLEIPLTLQSFWKDSRRWHKPMRKKQSKGVAIAKFESWKTDRQEVLPTRVLGHNRNWWSVRREIRARLYQDSGCRSREWEQVTGSLACSQKQGRVWRGIVS